MLVKRVCCLDGSENEMDLPVTEDQLIRWQQGEVIQDVMPKLTVDQREFLISGITPGKWQEVFGDE